MPALRKRHPKPNPLLLRAGLLSVEWFAKATRRSYGRHLIACVTNAGDGPTYILHSRKGYRRRK